MENTTHANLALEAEEYLSSMKSKYQTDTRNWDRFAKEVPDKFMQLVKSGLKPNITKGSSSSGSGRTLSVTLNFEANMDAAKKYVESLKTDIPKRGEAFHKTIDTFDKKLQEYHSSGLDGEIFEKLAKHFAQWVDYAQNLHVTIRDAKITVDIPQKYLTQKKHWLELADTQRLNEDAKRYGISVEDVPKHRKYLEGKQKKASAKTSAAMKQAIKLLQELGGYLDSAELLAQAEDAAAQLQSKEAEAERIRKAEEAQRKKEEAEKERIRKEKEAAEKAEAERIAKEEAKKAAEKAKKMRWRFAAGAGMIACSMYHVVAVKPDGTVVATGKNDNGQCNVSGWKNIVQVVCDEYGTAGLTAQGTVLYTGNTLHRQQQCTKWSNIKELAITHECIIGLRHDGTVVATTEGNNGAHFSSQPDVTTWKNITAIRAGEGNVLGIQDNDKIVAISRNYYGRCEEDYYMNGSSTAQDAAYGYLASGIVLHKDGKCTTAGTHYSYIKSPTEINKHNGIVKVHMLGSTPVAILADGKLIAEPDKDRRGRDSVAAFIKRYNLTNVVAISGNHVLFAILTADGRIYTHPRDSYSDMPEGPCFGEDFRLFDDFHAMMDSREAEAERIRKAREEERRKRAEEEARRAAFREQGVCQHCGGAFKKALFGVKCASCGTKKDY